MTEPFHRGLAAASDTVVVAPFTPEQVFALDRYQRSDGPWAMHPFTCANRGDSKHGRYDGDLGTLVPTTRGWICRNCDYTQNWAHTFMCDTPSPLSPVQIKYMVDRFLNWKLPANFCPDGGITFKPLGNEGTPYEYRHNPSGTNLLDATQALAMVLHMIKGMP